MSHPVRAFHRAASITYAEYVSPPTHLRRILAAVVSMAAATIPHRFVRAS